MTVRPTLYWSFQAESNATDKNCWRGFLSDQDKRQNVFGDLGSTCIWPEKSVVGPQDSWLAASTFGNAISLTVHEQGAATDGHKLGFNDPRDHERRSFERSLYYEITGEK